MFKRLSEISTDLNYLREKGRTRGMEIGWPYELLPITIKPGSTTYIAAQPTSGKTELWFEILINLSCKFGWKHLIFSPETGTAADVYAELCHKFIGAPIVKNNYRMMNDSDFQYAQMFVDTHFVVVDPVDEEMSIQQYYDMADKYENQHGIKFNTTTIDPWNELKEDFEPSDLGREDKYLSRILTFCRKNARKTGRHNCIINHVRDQQLIIEDKIPYYPIPTARDFAGGQVWFRKGNMVLIPWRPPFGLNGKDGLPYEENELHLKVAKSKPKGVSINGVYKLYLDLDRYQYYIMQGDKRIYADRGEYSYREPSAYGTPLIPEEPDYKEEIPF